MSSGPVMSYFKYLQSAYELIGLTDFKSPKSNINFRITAKASDNKVKIIFFIQLLLKIAKLIYKDT